MSAARLQEYMKSYVDLANRQYADIVVAEHQHQLALEREKLREKIAEEELRQRILGELKN